jgi:GntR family transcriptional regulator / MocR family aminotransferase
VLGGESGAHLGWVLPPGLPAAHELCRAALDQGVGVHVPPHFPINDAAERRFVDGTLYLGYAALEAEGIPEAVARLAGIVESCRALVA